MNSKHTLKEKQNIITAYKSGKSVSLLVTETGIPRSTIYAWLADARTENSEKKPSFTLREYRSLENKVSRLEGIIDILQKAPCTATAPLEDRLYALDDLHDQYSVHMLCDALCVPRGTFYNYLLRSKRGCAWYDKRREELRQKIQTVYDDSRQIYGAGKIAAVLREQGCRVSEQMVRELMQDMGLSSIRQGAKKQYDSEAKRCKNYLNPSSRKGCTLRFCGVGYPSHFPNSRISGNGFAWCWSRRRNCRRCNTFRRCVSCRRIRNTACWCCGCRTDTCRHRRSRHKCHTGDAET